MRVCSDRRICHSALLRVSPADAASLAEPQAQAAPPGVRMNDHFPGWPFDRVGGVQVPVASQLAVVVQQHVPGPRVAAVAQVQHDVLRQRAHPVVLGGALHERQDAGGIFGR